MLRRFGFILLIFMLTSCNVSKKQSQDLSSFFSMPNIKRDNKDLAEYNKLYPIYINDKVAFININGEELFPPKYDKIYFDYYRDFCFAKYKQNDIDRNVILFSDGTEIELDLDASYENAMTLYPMENGKYQYISSNKDNFLFLDLERKEFCEIPNNIKDSLVYSYCYLGENLFAVNCYNDGTEDKAYFIDYYGNVIYEESGLSISGAATYGDAEIFLGYYYDSSSDTSKSAYFDGNANKLYETYSRFFYFTDSVFVIAEEYINEGISSLMVRILDENFEEIRSFSVPYEGMDLLNNEYLVFHNYSSDDSHGLVVYDLYGNEIISRQDGYFSLNRDGYILFESYFDNSASEIFDEDFNSISQIDFLPYNMKLNNLTHNYAILSTTDSYAMISITEASKIGALDIQNSSENNLKWIIEPEMEYIYSPYSDESDNLIVTFPNGKGQNVFDLKSGKYIFKNNFANITHLDYNLYTVETPYFIGVINDKGDFVYATPSKNVNDD